MQVGGTSNLFLTLVQYTSCVDGALVLKFRFSALVAIGWFSANVTSGLCSGQLQAFQLSEEQGKKIQQTHLLGCSFREILDEDIPPPILFPYW